MGPAGALRHAAAIVAVWGLGTAALPADAAPASSATPSAAPTSAPAPSAPADAEGPASRAERLFNEGVEAAERNDHDEACARFDASLALVERASTHLNLGTCRAAQGQLATAYQHYEKGLLLLAPGDERIADTKSLLDALSGRVPRLAIALDPAVPPTGRVVVDGNEASRGKLASLPLDPGEHTIELFVPDHHTVSTKVELAEGDRKSIALAPGEPIEREKVVVQVAAEESGLVVPGLVIGAVGLAAAVVAGITGGLVIANDSTIQDNCWQERCNEEGLSAVESNDTLLVVNTISFVTAGVGIALGGALLVADAVMTPGGDEPAEAAAMLVPVVLPGGGLLVTAGRF